MDSRGTASSTGSKATQIASEMDRLLQRQVELMKAETFVGLTPKEREEYDTLREKIRKLFAELAKLK